LGAGLAVGLSGMAAGYTIGIVGDAVSIIYIHINPLISAWLDPPNRYH
jgi:hypothetical protein